MRPNHRLRLFVSCVWTSVTTVACHTAAAQADGAGMATRNLSTSAIDAVTRKQLLDARDAIWHAWFANDTVQLARLLPAAVAAGDGNQRWEDRHATLEGARGFATGGGKLVGLEFPRTEIRISGDVAVIFSTFVMETEYQGRRQKGMGRSTEVFVHQGGEWKNPFWHLGYDPDSVRDRGQQER
jgi:hypothetical protein